MARVEKNACDNCGKIIKEDRVKENQIKIYFGDNPYFIGEICDACRSMVEGELQTNQKVVKS